MKDEPLTTRDLADRRADTSTGTELPTNHPAESSPTPASGAAPMFGEDEGRGFQARWEAIQTGFVDEPRKAVEEADALVAQVMKRLAEVFATEREELERRWDRHSEISTEDLRQALQRYRSFFQRLLSI